MNCREWEERIALHAERDLPPREAAEAERHLAECADCREFSEGLSQTLAELREAHAMPLPPADFAAVRARVLAQLPPPRRPSWRLAWIGAVAVAALVVALMGGRRQPVERPRVAIQPSAPAVEEAVSSAPPREAPPRRAPRVRPRRKSAAPAEPLMVRVITDDPDLVIYWIAN